MTKEEIIGGLKFTVEMFMLDPSTGEKYTEPRNDMDKTTIDACKGAIELLEQMPDIAKYHEEHGEVVVDKAVWEDMKRILGQKQEKAEKLHTIRKFIIDKIMREPKYMFPEEIRGTADDDIDLIEIIA